jgi:hypothetical protein
MEEAGETMGVLSVLKTGLTGLYRACGVFWELRSAASSVRSGGEGVSSVCVCVCVCV